MHKEQTVYCRHCEKQVGYHFEPVNQWKNLLISVITFGLWLPMWLIMIFGPTKICNECNAPLWK